MGIITILDLASVHYKFSSDLQRQCSQKYDPKLIASLNRRKESELQAADYIFCISSLAQKSLIDNGVPRHKIRVVNLGADLKIFCPKEKEITKKFTILFVGSLTRQKGIHILLQAFEELDLENAELILIGPLVEKKLIKNSRCRYIDYLEHSKLVKYYQQANIFVLPSYLEGWGMVVNEAMACGTPVIISENVGSRDLVTEKCGFVVPVENVEALKEKITYCYNNREILKEMGEQAYQNVINYTWENYYNNLSDAIDQIWRAHHHNF